MLNSFLKGVKLKLILLLIFFKLFYGNRILSIQSSIIISFTIIKINIQIIVGILLIMNKRIISMSISSWRLRSLFILSFIVIFFWNIFWFIICSFIIFILVVLVILSIVIILILCLLLISELNTNLRNIITIFCNSQTARKSIILCPTYIKYPLPFSFNYSESFIAISINSSVALSSNTSWSSNLSHI